MPGRFVNTPGLDRLDAMQRTPVGASRPLAPPSAVSSQYRQQANMYGQALRNLNRAARRGDTQAGITAIGLRDKANADGFRPGGVRNHEQFQGNIEAREQSYQNEAQDMETAQRSNRDRVTNPLVAGRQPSTYGGRFQSSGYLSGLDGQQATDTSESYEETTSRRTPSSPLETTYGSFETPAVQQRTEQAPSSMVQQALSIRDRARQGAFDIPRSLADVPLRPETPLVIAGNAQDPGKFGLTRRDRQEVAPSPLMDSEARSSPSVRRSETPEFATHLDRTLDRTLDRPLGSPSPGIAELTRPDLYDSLTTQAERYRQARPDPKDGAAFRAWYREAGPILQAAPPERTKKKALPPTPPERTKKKALPPTPLEDLINTILS